MLKLIWMNGKSDGAFGTDEILFSAHVTCVWTTTMTYNATLSTGCRKYSQEGFEDKDIAKKWCEEKAANLLKQEASIIKKQQIEAGTFKELASR